MEGGGWCLYRDGSIKGGIYTGRRGGVSMSIHIGRGGAPRGRFHCVCFVVTKFHKIVSRATEDPGRTCTYCKWQTLTCVTILWNTGTACYEAQLNYMFRCIFLVT